MLSGSGSRCENGWNGSFFQRKFANNGLSIYNVVTVTRDANNALKSGENNEQRCKIRHATVSTVTPVACCLLIVQRSHQNIIQLLLCLKLNVQLDRTQYADVTKASFHPIIWVNNRIWVNFNTIKMPSICSK